MSDELPDDVQRWRALGPDHPLADLGVRFFDDGEVPEVLDTSYLTDADRADPAIVANVAAIDETAALITWVADADGSEAFGYWRGPEGTRLDRAAIVQLDTEGQFALIPGRTLTEALAWFFGIDDPDSWNEVVEAAASVGVAVAAADPGEVPDPDVPVAPNAHHEARYAAHLDGA